MTNNNNEIWVFLSHSNKDYDKVREVRNLLEEQNFRPLMFFLNCLNDDEEIDSLIKREIDSRKRFILCDSPNAQSSKWVQKEVDYIKSKQRYYYTLNLNDSSEKIAQDILQFTGESTVFISYSRNDEVLYEQLKTMLHDDLDLRVFDLKNDLISGGVYEEKIKEMIDKSLINGYVIFIITDNYLKSPYCLGELRYVLNNQISQNIIFLRDERVERPPFENYNIHKEFICNITGVESFIDKGKFYWEFMRERINEGVSKEDPASLYWLAHHFYYNDDRFDELNMSGMRESTLKILKIAIDKGYQPAKELYDLILSDYPELNGGESIPPEKKRITPYSTWIKEALGIKSK